MDEWNEEYYGWMEQHGSFQGLYSQYQTRMGGKATLAQDCDAFGVDIVASILVKSMEHYLRSL